MRTLDNLENLSFEEKVNFIADCAVSGLVKIHNSETGTTFVSDPELFPPSIFKPIIVMNLAEEPDEIDNFLQTILTENYSDEELNLLNSICEHNSLTLSR